jgi:hypothetical protein
MMKKKKMKKRMKGRKSSLNDIKKPWADLDYLQKQAEEPATRKDNSLYMHGKCG